MSKNIGMLILLVLIVLVSTIFQPGILESTNISNTIRWSATYSIIGIGVAFVIITGGIDLSIGSMVALVGCLLSYFLTTQGLNPYAAILAVLCSSLVLGLIYGLLITQLKLQPFVVTLCGLLMLRGFARVVANDQSVSGFSELDYLTQTTPVSIPVPFISYISQGSWGTFQWDALNEEYSLNEAGEKIALPLFEMVGIPIQLFYVIVIATLAAVFLNYSVWGRYLLALGKNEQAARYSGINTKMLTIVAYMICAFLSGIAGILFAVDIGSFLPGTHGNFYELYAIAAAVLGGCSLRGGEGSILGVIIGTAMLRVLYNSIEMNSINQYEYVVIGGVILAGVAFDEVARRVMARRRAIAEATLAESSVVVPSQDASNPSG